MKPTAASAILILAATLLTSSLSQAEESSKPHPQADLLKTIDQNADGKASKAEFFAALEKKFHSMDVDKSDVVSVEELKIYGEKDTEVIKKVQQTAIKKKPLEKSISEETFMKRFTDRAASEFNSLDKNHDKQLSADELGSEKKPKKSVKKTKLAAAKKLSEEEFIRLFTDSAAENFSQLDRDFDGELSAEELNPTKTTPQSKVIQAVVEKTPIDSKPMLDDKEKKKQELIKSFFVGIDANQDGKINAKEKAVAFERLFQRLDSNHDQFITQDEIIAGRHHAAVNAP
jgi:Ca2+-binding EF-hand superfamily protein